MTSSIMIAQHIINFYSDLKIPSLPTGIIAMNPYKNRDSMLLCEQFYNKYYSDSNLRTLMLGINPGRFGSGITGISFTDPVKLEDNCGIKNDFVKKSELSSSFIYTLIDAYGGAKEFYKKFFIYSVSPIGFIKDQKNANYYDENNLFEAVKPLITESMEKIISNIGIRSLCFCVGEGKNFKFLSNLNSKHRWFKKIVPMPHPRYIMQYRRKQVPEFVKLYLEKLVG